MAQVGETKPNGSPPLDLTTVQERSFDRPIPVGKRARYSEVMGGVRYDYFWAPLKGAKRLVVLFCGHTPRDKFPGPAFQRWSWSRKLNAHCLCVSDPALFRHERIGLAWYAGGLDFDPMPQILSRVLLIAERLGIEPHRVWTYGSSGGGFAALRAAAMQPGLGAVATNPQTTITRYHRALAPNYLSAFWGGRGREAALADFPERLSLLPHAQTLAQRRIVIAQNDADVHHLEEHYKPLCEAMGHPEEAGVTASVRRVRFYDSRGHGAAEKGSVFPLLMEQMQAAEDEGPIA